MPRPKEKRAPVIKDVAALANVSVSTVSRYLNDSPRISDESRERIAHAIKLLDYHPSRVARGLVNAAMKSIAVMTSDTTLYGSAMTIQGIEDEARANNYPVSISKLDDDSAEGLRASITMVMDQNPSGVIVMKYDELAAKALHMLPDTVTKVVIAGDREPDLDQVDLRENQSGREITEYLLSLGHSNVYHVTIPGGGGGYIRTAGWEAALRANDKPIPDMRHCSWLPSDARELGHAMAGIEGLSAIFAGNDEIAMGLIRGLEDEGKSVPDDISVIGFDDHPLACVWTPPLTTYRQDFPAAGRKAVELLLSRLEAREQGEELPPRFVELQGELVVRSSAAAPRA
ncbi:LacI family DNA-binding transcriptional regulator [Bifidobacterium miconisargentati]|uniref:LacI family DNA-binding transcriptional regulator n=1 Tax=Bifidobacterium miconisargentati TaxID=2834437 RepID=UPI001BDD9CB1|nr:LacI family DNA-binding transcriptional regulator [Bifidobacterium miconisargentati]MBW3090791.1 LacI family DNA-binding transcriptional regulator [Bifidobacterium miconisargentati]